jgi:hypothetical protein
MSVFVIDKIRRAAFKPYKGQQTREKDRNIRRRIVRGRRSMISDRGNSNGSQSTSNVVLSETGYSVTVNNGGGIYRLQRGGQRCELDSTAPEQVITNDTPSTAVLATSVGQYKIDLAITITAEECKIIRFRCSGKCQCNRKVIKVCGEIFFAFHS